MLGVSVTAKPGENAAAGDRATGVVRRRDDRAAVTATRSVRSARQIFGMFLGTAEVPDFALAQNPYGAALSLARREQLGIDTVKLNRAFDALTEADLRRAAARSSAESDMLGRSFRWRRSSG